MYEDENLLKHLLFYFSFLKKYLHLILCVIKE